MRGLILYGPPAAGKDTITTELGKIDSKYQLYPRLKVGPGRTSGYRMGTEDQVAALREAGEVVWENRRYDAIYVVDRESLFAMLAAGRVPVIHLGQVPAVTAVNLAVPGAQWLVAYLWCPRAIAASRIAERGTGDTAERLRAWDVTAPLHEADLVLNTAELSPQQAAAEIHARLDHGMMERANT